MNDAAFVDLRHTSWGCVDKCHVSFIECGQVFIVKSRTLAAVRIEGLQRFSGCRIFDHCINPVANLLHDSEVGIKLLLNCFLDTEFLFVMFVFLERVYLACQIVVVRFHCRAARRDFGKSRSSGFCPAWLMLPSFDFFLRRCPLITDVN